MGSGLNGRGNVFRGLSVLVGFPEQTNYKDYSKIFVILQYAMQKYSNLLGETY